jgi:hypothetical protein
VAGAGAVVAAVDGAPAVVEAALVDEVGGGEAVVELREADEAEVGLVEGDGDAALAVDPQPDDPGRAEAPVLNKIVAARFADRVADQDLGALADLKEVAVAAAAAVLGEAEVGVGDGDALGRGAR